jgi:hypothetical protein
MEKKAYANLHKTTMNCYRGSLAGPARYGRITSTSVKKLDTFLKP